MSNIDKIEWESLILTNKIDVLNPFNSYFCSIGEDISSKIPTTTLNFSSFLKDKLCNSFQCFDVSAHEILNVLNDLANSKSPGPDDLSPYVLKMASKFIAQPLTHLINLSFKSGIFPNDLKKAKVIPLFKKGDPTCIPNYRPISLLSVLSKIIEKLMYSRVSSFFNKFKLFYKYQFGFRKHHSTTHALLNAVNLINRETAANKCVMGLFLDLQKAFDTVNHNILLHKLDHYGIRGNTLLWFKSYLQNRCQFTSLDGFNSSLSYYCYGLPQGSILGPLLFLICQ